MTVYRKRRQSQRLRQQQRQRRWTQRGGECGKFRGRSVLSVCALSPAEIKAYSGVSGCSAAELITRIKSEGTCDPAKKIALLKALGEEPEKEEPVRHEVPGYVYPPMNKETYEKAKAEKEADAKEKAEKAAAAAAAKEQSTKNLEALRGINAERKRFTNFLPAVKRIKTPAVQAVIQEKLMALSPEQIAAIRQTFNDAKEVIEADKLAIFDRIVSDLHPVNLGGIVGLTASNGGRGNVSTAGPVNVPAIAQNVRNVPAVAPNVRNTGSVNMSAAPVGYPEPPPGSRGEKLAAALAENYPNLEELEARQNWANKFKRQPPPPPPPSSFYNMSRNQRKKYYASGVPEAPGSLPNNVNLLDGAGGISYHLDPQFRPQGNNTTRTVHSSGSFRGGVRRKTRKPRQRGGEGPVPWTAAASIAEKKAKQVKDAGRHAGVVKDPHLGPFVPNWAATRGTALALKVLAGQKPTL